MRITYIVRLGCLGQVLWIRLFCQVRCFGLGWFCQVRSFGLSWFGQVRLVLLGQVLQVKLLRLDPLGQVGFVRLGFIFTQSLLTLFLLTNCNQKSSEVQLLIRAKSILRQLSESPNQNLEQIAKVRHSTRKPQEFVSDPINHEMLAKVGGEKSEFFV